MIPFRLLDSFIFRQALLYTALSVVSMMILFGFIYWATAGYMDRELDATIDEEILGLSEQYDSGGFLGLSRIIEERISHNPKGPAIYLLADENHRPLVGNLNVWPGKSVIVDGWTRFLLSESGNVQLTEHEVRARIFQLPNNLHLLVGRDVSDLEHSRHLILTAMAWGMAITIALALGIGLFMSSRVIRRIEAIHQTCREIMDGDLSRRMPVAGSGDDFDKLAKNLNRMLERIESLMVVVQQISNNIAHDLRTPLTRLRTRLEQARNGESGYMQAQIDEAIMDAEELLATFNALLRIARIESGSSPVEFTTLDLSSLIQDVAELYEPVAAQNQQQLIINDYGPVTAQGDRHLLFQALANLVENAIRHTPEGTSITLEASTSASGPKVQVADTGPGIPAQLHQKVFQRFFRIDASRSTSGSGLGLSLVRAVADIHHARIELMDNLPGLKVTLVFFRDTRRLA